MKTFTLGKVRFPEMVALLVTTSELMVVTAPNDALLVTDRALTVAVPVKVALFVTDRALTVAVPVVLSAPETVTLHPAPGCRIILEVAES